MKQPIRVTAALLISTILLTACGNKDTGSASKTAETPAPSSQKAEASMPASTEMSSSDTSEETLLAMGKKSYSKCRACHTLEEGKPNRVGPNLYGVIGQPSAQIADFNYSEALKTADIIWTDENLDAYIASPRTFIKGNRMSFVGIKNEDERRALIAYLKAETGQ